MPLYEYYCADCQTKFDALRPMSKADEDIECKNCESIRTSRVLSLFATFSKENGGAGQSTMPAGFGGCCGGGCGCSH